MTRTELLTLAERVEAGETGYELSDACWIAAGWRDGGRYWYSPTDGLVCAVIMPDLTASIDAQDALTAQVIVSMYEPETGMWEAQATTDPHDDSPLKYGCAPTERAARLAAILRTMAEREPEA